MGQEGDPLPPTHDDNLSSDPAKRDQRVQSHKKASRCMIAMNPTYAASRASERKQGFKTNAITETGANEQNRCDPGKACLRM